MKLIRFQGNEYILAGSLESGGPIATREQYEQGLPSYAQLTPDGSVWRFRDSIGHRDEIEVVGEVDVKQSHDSFLKNRTHPDWRFV